MFLALIAVRFVDGLLFWIGILVWVRVVVLDLMFCLWV